MATVPSKICLPICCLALCLALSPVVACGQTLGPMLLPPTQSGPLEYSGAPESSLEELPQYNNAPAPASQSANQTEADPEVVITPRLQIPTFKTPAATEKEPASQPATPRIQSHPDLLNRTRKPVVPPTYKAAPSTPTPVQTVPDTAPPSSTLTAPATPEITVETNRPAGGSWREADYWIVSSRRLPQSPSGQPSLQGESAELDYIHFDEDRTFRRYPRDKYQNWFDPGTPVCFIVHGSFTSWESLRFESGHLYHWLKRSAKDEPLQIVFFTWPSASQLTGLLATDVERLGTRATFNARYLREAVVDLPEESPVTLLGHSHGARMCAQTLQDLDRSPEWNQRENQADLQAIFIAAAFDHFWLQPGQPNDRVVHRADRILNMKNSNDLALAFYSMQGSTGAEPLGRVGFTPQSRQVIGPNMSKVQEIDLAPFIGTAHLWSSFYQRGDLGKYVSDFVLSPTQTNGTPTDASELNANATAPTNVRSHPSDVGIATRDSLPQVQTPQARTNAPVAIQPIRINTQGRSRMQPFAAGLPLIRGRRPLPSISGQPTAQPPVLRKW